MEIFISYAEADLNILNNLETHLVSFTRRRNWNQAWSNKDISAGQNRQTEISSHLERADIIFFLVSPDFLADTNLVDGELARAFKRGQEDKVIVIPIIIRPCDWDEIPNIKALQILPRSKRPITQALNEDEAWQSIISELDNLLEDQNTSQVLNPELLDTGNLPQKSGELEQTIPRLEVIPKPIFSQSSQHRPDLVLNRGEIFEQIIDATIKINTSGYDDEASNRKHLENMVHCENYIPAAYIYREELGAMRWLQLKNDPGYTISENSCEFLRRHALRIKNTIEKALQIKFSKTKPDYISLGPGDGEKDLILMREFFIDGNACGESNYLFYYPVDISIFMISTAFRQVIRDKKLRQAIKIKSICSDFNDLSHFKSVFDYRPQPNVFLLLGNTLGNQSDEIDFLRSLHAGMNKGDILILEVRIINYEEDMRPGGDIYLLNQFNFTPLECLGYTLEQSEISYPLSDTSCTQIPNTMTYTVNCDNRTISDNTICLNYYNRYDKIELTRALENNLKFHIVDVIDNNSLALYILRK